MNLTGERGGPAGKATGAWRGGLEGRKSGFIEVVRRARRVDGETLAWVDKELVWRR